MVCGRNDWGQMDNGAGRIVGMNHFGDGSTWNQAHVFYYIQILTHLKLTVDFLILPKIRTLTVILYIFQLKWYKHKYFMPIDYQNFHSHMYTCCEEITYHNTFCHERQMESKKGGCNAGNKFPLQISYPQKIIQTSPQVTS